MDSKLVYAVTLVMGCWVLAAKGLKLNDTHSVGVLNAPITRDTCGQRKICLETPADCDPSSNGTCLFFSASSGTTRGRWLFSTNVNFELRGDSENYIFFLLSTNNTSEGTEGAVCAQYNNTARFFTVTYNNGSLTVKKTAAVSDVRASLHGTVIRCTFSVLAANGTGRPANFFVFAGNGNFSNGILGRPEITLRSNGSVDLTSLLPTPQTMTTTNPTTNMNPIPVGGLSAPINRGACARTKLCLEVPEDCDPSSNGSCLFISASPAATTRPGGTNIQFELRGKSRGYIVLILSRDKTQGGGDDSFICAQSNNSIHFFIATFDNGTLNRSRGAASVKNVQASVSDNVIRCTFTVLGLNATANRNRDSSFYVFAGNGTFDNGNLGNTEIILSSNRSLDLTNSTSNMPGANGGTSLHPASLVLFLLSAMISRLV